METIKNVIHGFYWKKSMVHISPVTLYNGIVPSTANPQSMKALAIILAIVCVSGARVLEDCEQGYYYNITTGKCEDCSLVLPHCEHCENATHCLACDNQTILENGTCNLTPEGICGVGEYEDDETGQCISCRTIDPHCTDCVTADTCTVCELGYRPAGNRCIKIGDEDEENDYESQAYGGDEEDEEEDDEEDDEENNYEGQGYEDNGENGEDQEYEDNEEDYNDDYDNDYDNDLGANKTETQNCAEGYYWDAQQGKCVKEEDQGNQFAMEQREVSNQFLLTLSIPFVLSEIQSV
eukprot:TRINITY_DN661_c0_g2_i1.p1 TRINITY_DN661_c0_g2~~TRINITY_DN661_c0_g2_i1.p1  ORF type:complete len:294 (-),score=33.71 TRINITY_DN661_c0_g2_i1:41-922(-)